MTDPAIDIDELERLEKAATPGPWKWSYHFLSLDAGKEKVIWPSNAQFDPENAREGLGACGKHAEPDAEANAALIAALRNDATELLRLARLAATQADEIATLKAQADALTALSEAAYEAHTNTADGLRAQIAALRAKYLCPIGAENGSDLCSAGSCPECVGERLDAQIAVLREERDDFGARASMIDEAEFANSTLVRKLSERDGIIASLRADLASARALLVRAGEAAGPFLEWAKHDLVTADELQLDFMSYEDDCEADVRDFDGNSTRPLLWGDFRRLREVAAAIDRRIAELSSQEAGT